MSRLHSAGLPSIVDGLTEEQADAAYVARADAGGAYVFADESTTSTGFTDLATAGPAETVTIGATGRALVIVSGTIRNNTAAAYTLMGFAISGASTAGASDNDSLLLGAGGAGQELGSSRATFVEGLTPGSTTFTAKYRVSGGTGNFARRRITVIPF